MPDVVAIHVLLRPPMDDPVSQLPPTAASQHHPWGRGEDTGEAKHGSGCLALPGTRCPRQGPFRSLLPALLKPQPKKKPRTSGASPMSGLWSAVKDSTRQRGPGQAFWGHITHFRSRVPTASCARLGLLLFPERLMGPELDQQQALPSIPAPASPTCASPTAPKGEVFLVLGCPSSRTCLVQAPEANIHTNI